MFCSSGAAEDRARQDDERMTTTDNERADDQKASRALVVGRFQPPHRGHLEVLRAAVDSAREVVVVVGSAQRSHTVKNPLTSGERVEGLTALFKDEGLQVALVIPVMDLDQYHLWVAHVEAHVPPFDLVVSANPMTLHLFKEAGYPTKRVELVDRERLSGTRIRQMLFAGEDVSSHLTPGVLRLLERPEIQARLQAIQAQSRGPSG